MENTIKDKLDELQTAKDYLSDITKIKQNALDEALTPEVREKIEAIEAEFAALINAATDKANALEGEIKSLVLQHGTSVKGTYLYAVYNNGRVSWDNKGLDGFMVAHPEMEKFRSVGQPTVTLRKVGNQP